MSNVLMYMYQGRDKMTHLITCHEVFISGMPIMNIGMVSHVVLNSQAPATW